MASYGHVQIRFYFLFSFPLLTVGLVTSVSTCFTPLHSTSLHFAITISPARSVALRLCYITATVLVPRDDDEAVRYTCASLGMTSDTPRSSTIPSCFNLANCLSFPLSPSCIALCYVFPTFCLQLPRASYGHRSRTSPSFICSHSIERLRV